MMDIDQFWKVIEHTRSLSEDNPTKQAELITAELLTMPLEGIFDYTYILWSLRAKADRHDLRAVAELITEGLSESTWESFLSWLVGQGKTVYENVLADPDILVDIVPEKARYDAEMDSYDIVSDELGYTWMTAYLTKTGSSELPDYHPINENFDKGENLREGVSSEEEYNNRLKAKFPKTWARFGYKTTP